MSDVFANDDGKTMIPTENNNCDTKKRSSQTKQEHHPKANRTAHTMMLSDCVEDMVVIHQNNKKSTYHGRVGVISKICKKKVLVDFKDTESDGKKLARYFFPEILESVEDLPEIGTTQSVTFFDVPDDARTISTISDSVKESIDIIQRFLVLTGKYLREEDIPEDREQLYEQLKNAHIVLNDISTKIDVPLTPPSQSANISDENSVISDMSVFSRT